MSRPAAPAQRRPPGAVRLPARPPGLPGGPRRALPADPVLALGLRSLPWLVAGAVVGLLAGLAVLLSAAPSATATAAVELTPVAQAVDLTGGQPVRAVSVDTDAQLVTSDRVVQAVAAATGRTPARAQASLSVSAPQLTRVLQITCRDRSPRAAQAGADAAAAALLQARDQLVVAPLRAALQELGQAVDTAPAPAPAAPPAASPSPGNAATPAPADGVDAAAPLTRLQAALRAEAALTVPGTVLQRALATPADDRGPLTVPLASGAGTGALLALGLAVLRDRRRARAPAPLPATTAGSGPGTARHRRRRPLLAVLVVAVPALLGAGAGVRAQPRVDVHPLGTAEVLVRPLPGNAFPAEPAGGVDTSVELATEAQLATADAVLEPVVAVSGVPLRGLRQRVTVTVVKGTEVLDVQVRGLPAARAADAARAVATTLLAVRTSRATAAAAARTALVQQRVDQTAAALTRAGQPGGDPTLAPGLSARLVVLRDDLRAASAPVARPGSVVDAGTAPRTARRLLRAALPVAGLLAGAAAGLLVLAAARRRRRLTAGAGAPAPAPVVPLGAPAP